MIMLRDIQKTFTLPAGPFAALNHVNLDIAAGSFVAIVGESGSGKSTLLNVLAGVERPTSGSVHIADVPLHSLTERELTRWRGNAAGIVFQFFQLMPTLTAAENVMLAMDFVGRWAPGERRERAESLLRRLGVAAQADKLPLTLSGGQQQRVAIARALANGPTLLLADEPTGNLDSRTSDAIFELFAALAETGETVVMATHAAAAGRFATRTIALADGRVVTS